MRLKMVIAAVAVAVLMCGQAYCEEEKSEKPFADLFAYSGKIGVAANVSAAIPTEAGADTTVFLGGYVSYDILNCIAVGAESGWAQWNEKSNGVDYGKSNMVPLFGDIYLKAPFKVDRFKIVPYGVVGIGVVFWNFDESQLLKDNGISVNIDTSFAMKFGGGMDFFLTDNIAVFGEGSFIWSDAKVTVSGRGSVASATIDTDLWLVGGGIKYVF